MSEQAVTPEEAETQSILDDEDTLAALTKAEADVLAGRMVTP